MEEQGTEYDYRIEYYKYGPLQVNVDRASDEESVDYDDEEPCPPSPRSAKRKNKGSADAVAEPVKAAAVAKPVKEPVKVPVKVPAKKGKNVHVVGQAWLQQVAQSAQRLAEVRRECLFLFCSFGVSKYVLYYFL